MNVRFVLDCCRELIKYDELKIIKTTEEQKGQNEGAESNVNPQKPGEIVVLYILLFEDNFQIF